MTETTLIRGAWVFAQAADEAEPRVLNDAAVAVRDGFILEIATFDGLRREHPDAPVIGDGTAALIPGLINAHHHSNAVTHTQHGIEDGVLEPWILGNARIRHMDPRLRVLVSAGRLLQTGVTSVVDMASVGAADQAGHDDLLARLHAYEESGLRGRLAGGVSFHSRLVHREDEAFVASLPGDLRARVQRRYMDADRGSEDGYLEIVEDLIRVARNMKRTQAWYGPPGPQWVGDDLMVKIADAAARHDVGIQTHVQESFYERLEAERALGKSMTRHMADLGVLSPRMSFAHAVWSTEADIAILAETGTSISHNPSSNLRLRSGIAPLNAMRAAGVTVGLGMDGTTIGDDEDMFAEMRLAHRLHRTARIGGPAPTVAETFAMTTTVGAKLLREEGRLGRLAPGMAADMVLVDLRRISWPYVAPEADPLALVVERAKQGDVRTVLVGGEVVLENGLPTKFDFVGVAEELGHRLAEAPIDTEFAALYTELRPHIEAWYAAWPAPDLEPWSVFNSRI
jgi:cytosine/adenosine deaminase-related metal-dependent hydrolase